MSPAKVLLASLCMGLGALALASDPTPSATPPGSTDTASPAAADSAAADKAAADKAAADKAAADKAAADKAKSAAKTAPGGITPDQAKTLRIAGYKADVQKDGHVLYCRSEPKMGSFFETKVCGTPDDILLRTASDKDVVKQMQGTATAVRTN
jgi:hypothetical protein